MRTGAMSADIAGAATQSPGVMPCAQTRPHPKLDRGDIVDMTGTLELSIM